MRNLKRALSLALASVMLLGMMVVGTSAASTDFADVEDIKNVYAVDITSELGIFSGKGDDKFDPTATVTRAEMATLIVKMLEGAKFNADAYKAITLFDDIPADMDWAKGYINYAAQTGILAGKGNNKFDPAAAVTTAEAITFIINALKVDAGEGTWPNTVMTKAVEMKLFGDLVLGTNDELTRDDLAVLLVEGLLYEVPGTGKYKVTINVAGSADPAVVTEAQSQVFTSVIEASLYMANLKTAGLTNDATKFVVESVPANNTLNLKFGLLRTGPDKGGVDEFGRAATNYTATAEGFEKLTYDVATANFVYEGGVAPEEIAKDLKNFDYTGATMFVDGKPASSTINQAAIATAAGSNVAKVEVFTKKTGTVTYVENIVVTNTYATLAKEATEDIEVDDEVVVAEGELYIEPTSGYYYVIDLAGVAADDVVLYTVADDEVQTTAAAKKITSKMTSYTNDGVYTIAGGEYVLAAEAGQAASLSASTLKHKDRLSGNYVYYIGVYGTIVKANAVPGTTTTTTPTDYAYVVKTNVAKTDVPAAWGAEAGFTVTAELQVATSKGEVVIYPVELKKADDAISNTTIVSGDYYFKIGSTYVVVYDASEDSAQTNAQLSTALAAKLTSVYNYSVNSKGNIVLGTVTGIGSQTEAGIVLGTGVAEPVGKGDVALTVNTNKVVALDAGTKFLFVDIKADYTKTKATVKVGSSCINSQADLATSKIVGVIANASAASDALYVAEYVFVTAAVPSAETISSDDLVYVTTDYVVKKDKEFTHTAYKADGTTITLIKKNSAVSTAGIYKYNTDGTIGDKDSTYSVSGEYTKVSNTVIKIKDSSNNEHYIAVTAETATVIIAADAKLENGCTVTAVKNADGVVYALFVTAAKVELS